VNLVRKLLPADSADSAAPALTEGARQWSFGELRAAAASIAAVLAERGIGARDRVVLLSGNDVAFVAAYLGILAAGGIATPLNPQAPMPELEREIALVEASLVLRGPACAGLALANAVDIEPLFSTGKGGLDPVDRADDDGAVLLFTSGTAGAPRAALLTHGNLAANIDQVQRHPGLRVGPRDVGLVMLPCFHVFGLNVALGVALAAGMHNILLGSFDAAEAVRAIAEHEVTIVAGVPTMYDAMLELGDDVAPPDALRSLRLAVSGAAELPPRIGRAFHDRFGVVLHEGYGLTEASPIVTTNAADPEPRWGSIGPPVPGVEVRLVGPKGEDVLVGDPGEIWVRGPNVFPGYWRDPEASERVLAGGWLHTGDVAVAEPDGMLRLVDRSKDLVIVSGFNVFPNEVEDALLTFPDVIDAAVIGVPDRRTGEAVAAFVVCAEGCSPAVDEVREHVARSLARYKVPSTIDFVEELPRNVAGKLLRRELRAPDATRNPA
jgi:long-chain acyl-CoA synthetase